MLSDRDRKEIVEQGFDIGVVESQLRNFKEGFPSLKLVSAATINNGVVAIPEADIPKYIAIYDGFEGKSVKFVPASGAATRMFRALYEMRDDLKNGISVQTVFSQNKEAKCIFQNLKQFAFYPDLEMLLNEKRNTLEENTKEWYISLIDLMLNKEGLNYEGLPKGLIKFHRYGDGTSRTAVVEHLVEGVLYSKNSNNEVDIHFTVSPQHKEYFKIEVDKALGGLDVLQNVSFNVTYSVQNKITDTIAVDMQNIPFRDGNGDLVFRPAGHGALLDNLNSIDADILFIKNVDNVVPDRLKSITVTYKKLLAGILIDIQRKAFDLLQSIDDFGLTKENYKLFDDFLLLIGVKNSFGKNVEAIKNALNRPIRVCGMVKNQGEPGGGPFIAYNGLGEISYQIVESSQVDYGSIHQKNIFNSSTHFNPVDLVCGVRDYKGNKFDLMHFIDSETGFISIKSKDGRSLKAMELPGLWNGSMSNWITLFVEVPVSTFNPVKTLMDLLRVEHI